MYDNHNRSCGAIWCKLVQVAQQHFSSGCLFLLSKKFEFCKKINNLIFPFSVVEDAYSIRIILLSFEFHPILSFDNLCMKDPLSLIFLFQSPENILEITTITLCICIWKIQCLLHHQEILTLKWALLELSSMPPVL